MAFNPLYSFINTLRYLLTGRIRFPQQRVGEKLLLEDGCEWTVFREVVIDPDPSQSEQPGVIFRPRFHVANMTVRQNMRFSWLPVPFFVGLPGFRRKLWLYQEESGDFQGIYQWDTAEAARQYAGSFAMRFMTRRSLPGSVSYRLDQRDQYPAVLLAAIGMS